MEDMVSIVKVKWYVNKGRENPKLSNRIKVRYWGKMDRDACCHIILSIARYMLVSIVKLVNRD